MKINDVKALDYRTDGDLLTIPFADTSVEAVLALDAAVLTVKPDENSGVKWFTPDGAVQASSEPWFREHIYNKLNEKMRQFHAEKK